VTRVYPTIAEGARSLKEKLTPGLWYLDRPRDIHRDISERDIEMFADLLSKLLKFDPKERLTAKEELDHT
jgi:serine/threonine protein kinase